MSTFDGFVKEFPNIRIDHFRLNPDRPPPAACFLSHVHSDHLVGLESLKMPFVYCSATSRRLLLRMEKYPHRVNFAKGILESRKQHYKHLKLILRALPLQTAVELELNPKSRIQVTLFDANHCPGAVMFLIEGDSKAILYTGDIRAETWWVNSIVQNPIILPYALKQKCLDCIYLDTTFASREDPYKCFLTKAEGLSELLEKVSKYPENTCFYFRAWTLGYEQVWIALRNALRCQVHVDEYQLRLFNAITENGKDGYSMFEGPALAGFTVGNHEQNGCLSTSQDTAIHSCEPGSDCYSQLKTQNVVWITPIVSRLADGTEVLELGAGGGAGDLYQTAELELNDVMTLEALRSFSCTVLREQAAIQNLSAALEHVQRSGTFKVSLNGLGLSPDEEISLKKFVEVVSSSKLSQSEPHSGRNLDGTAQDRVIHFPYSRHSSYEELRYLVSVFQPKDLCACTVELDGWTDELSMLNLFGDLCSQDTFYHDKQTWRRAHDLKASQNKGQLKRKTYKDSQTSEQEDEEDPRTLKNARAILTGVDEKAVAYSVGLGRFRDSESMSQRPLLAPTTASTRHAKERSFKDLPPHLRSVRDAFRASNDGSDLIMFEGPTNAEQHCREQEADGDSQCTLSTSMFDSQKHHEDEEDQNDSRPNDETANSQVVAAQEKRVHRSGRVAARRDAFKAACTSLDEGINTSWEHLNVPAFGRGAHTDEEVEL